MNIECLQAIKCDQGAIRAVRFNVDGSYCLTCGADKKIKLWNPHKSLYLKTYGGHGNEVLDACGSCDNSQIVSCGSDKSVILWDVSTGQSLRRLRGHAGTVTCVKFNEDSSVAISGSHDNTVLCWDVKSRKNDPIQVLRDAKDGITSIQVTDHEILVGSLDCVVRCYDIRNGQVVTDFIGEPITCVSFTRDSQCTVVSTSDDVVRLLDKSTGELLSEYKGHTAKDYLIESCINHKDTHIMSGSADGNVYCWELISGSISKLLPHIEGQTVHSLSPHPTQNYYLTASGSSIYLWGEKKNEESAESLSQEETMS